MSAATAPSAEAPSPHHWTLDEYHRAIDAGVFGDSRVELLHGEVLEMPPMNEPHIGAVRYLAGAFVARLGWARVASRTAIILPSDGEPEPDVAVSEPGAPLKPDVNQVQLVIEVSQSTHGRDLGTKLEDYLRDGLRELWIIDLVEQCALIYRDDSTWRAANVGQVRSWSRSASRRSVSTWTRSSARLVYLASRATCPELRPVPDVGLASSLVSRASASGSMPAGASSGVSRAAELSTLRRS